MMSLLTILLYPLCTHRLRYEDGDVEDLHVKYIRFLVEDVISLFDLFCHPFSNSSMHSRHISSARAYLDTVQVSSTSSVKRVQCRFTTFLHSPSDFKRKQTLSLSRRGLGKEGQAQIQYAAFRGREKMRLLEMRLRFRRVSGVTSAEFAIMAES
jgi:hypothetical protein